MTDYYNLPIQDMGSYFFVHCTSSDGTFLNGVKTFLKTATKPVCLRDHIEVGYIEWYLNGYLYCPFGGPSKIKHAGNNTHIQYTNSDGKLHNTNGPAFIKKHERTSYDEKWLVNGEFHRTDGPAYTEIKWEKIPTIIWDRETNKLSNGDVVPREHNSLFPSNATVEQIQMRVHRYQQNGIEYNDGGPTEIRDRNALEHSYFDNKGRYCRTYFALNRSYFFRNAMGTHRKNGPAVIHMNNCVEKFVDGVPMPMTYNQVYSGLWSINNKNIDLIKIKELARRNNITLLDHPCHDRSAFVNDSDEMTMITLLTKLA